MSTGQDYYRLLGVSRDASERDIKRAYYELARQLHPDKASSPEEAARNEERLAQISKAYNTLKDVKKRGEYDTTLRGRPASSLNDQPTPRPTPASAAPAPASGRAIPPAAAKSPGGPATPIPVAAKAPPTSNAATLEEESSTGGLSSAKMIEQRRAQAQKAFVLGLQAVKAQDWKKALPFFENAAQNDPDGDAQYHAKLAQALMQTRGSFTRAVEHAQKAVELDPYNIEFKLALGDVYDTAGVTSKAIEVFQDVLRWDGDNQQAKMRLNILGVKSGGKKSPGAGNPLLAKLFPSLFKK